MASVHLLVLIHGMWGKPEHVAELARIAEETHPKTDDGVQLKVLLAEKNRDDSTYDGIDWGGERVAKEVMSEVEKLEKDGKNVTRFSVTGYSLGGLVARYLVGILYQRDFFKTVTPVNFNTVATPHLGLTRHSGTISSIKAALGPRLLSRTGEQFYCVDKWSKTERPLLEVMADPECIFYRALLKFPHITIYANAINDVTVPYVTSAIETEDPFAEYEISGIEIEYHETYQPLIKSYTVPSSPPAKPKVLSVKWFKRLKPERPLLPPALQLRFPLNVVLYVFLPVLVPLVISLGILRLSLATRSSRARIKLMEEDESSGQRLADVVAQLEQRVEDAVVDIIEGGDPSSSTPATDDDDEKEDKVVAATGAVTAAATATAVVEGQQPLTPLQIKIAGWLNGLPGLKKEKAYIPGVRNSHAVIVCRDVKRFPGHKLGEGVIRHWAGRFVL